jgi:hypothetical protein
MYDNLILGIHTLSIWFGLKTGCDNAAVDETARRVQLVDARVLQAARIAVRCRKGSGTRGIASKYDREQSVFI